MPAQTVNSEEAICSGSALLPLCQHPLNTYPDNKTSLFNFRISTAITKPCHEKTCLQPSKTKTDLPASDISWSLKILDLSSIGIILSK